MAYSATQEPSLFAGTGQPIIFVVYDDARTGNSKFRYICDVYINGTASANKVARLKQLPNAQSRGVFDISKIVNSYLYPTKVNQGSTTTPIHLLPKDDIGDPFSQNDSSLESVVCKFGVEFSTSATTAPTVSADEFTEDVVYCIQGSIPYFSSPQGGNYDFAEFIPDGTSKRFLTNMPDYTIDGQTISVSNDEWRTMAFLNDSADCELNRLYVQIFNSSGSKLNTSNDYFENTNANGGANPSSEVNTDAERLIFVGVGVKNLNIQNLHTDMRISSHATASYYEVFGANGSGTQKTTKYRFSLDGNDCKYPMKQLAWKNRFGQWDYFTFKKKDEKNLSITRTSMEKPIGDFNSLAYSENSFRRGTETLTTNATYQQTVNSDYLTELQAEWMEGLFTSNDVYLINTESDIFNKNCGQTISADNPDVLPVVITSAEYKKKTSVNDKCQIQYTLTYNYSHKQRVAI